MILYCHLFLGCVEHFTYWKYLSNCDNGIMSEIDIIADKVKVMPNKKVK